MQGSEREWLASGEQHGGQPLRQEGPPCASGRVPGERVSLSCSSFDTQRAPPSGEPPPNLMAVVPREAAGCVSLSHRLRQRSDMEVRCLQARETSRGRSGVGANSIPNMRDPSLQFCRQQDAASDLIGASHDYGSHVPKALMHSGLSMPTSLMSSYTDYDLHSARPPSSHVDSCPTP